jgi:ASC-1-like (ASCH) protein
MAIHQLKTHPQYFDKVKTGEKTFELRKNDRNFEVGNTLILRRYPLNKDYKGSKMKYRVLEQYSKNDKAVRFYPQYKEWSVDDIFCRNWNYYETDIPGFWGQTRFPTKKEAEAFIESRIPKVHDFPGAYYQRPWPEVKRRVKEEPTQQEYGEG